MPYTIPNLSFHTCDSDSNKSLCLGGGEKLFFEIIWFDDELSKINRFLEDGDLHTDYKRERQFKWAGLDDRIEVLYSTDVVYIEH